MIKKELDREKKRTSRQAELVLQRRKAAQNRGEEVKGASGSRRFL